MPSTSHLGIIGISVDGAWEVRQGIKPKKLTRGRDGGAMSNKSESVQPPSRNEKKRWLEPKDYLTISLSALALLISAMNAFFGVILTKESILLVDNREPGVSISNDQLWLSSTDENEGQVSILNSGNRTAVVTRLDLGYVQPKNAQRWPTCDNDFVTHFATDFGPAVLKPGEAIVTAIRAKKPVKYFSNDPTAEVSGSQGFVLPRAPHNQNSKNVLFDVCLRIYLSTPSKSVHVVEFPAMRFHADVSGWSYDPNSEGPLNQRPVTLVSNTTTIIGEFIRGLTNDGEP